MPAPSPIPPPPSPTTDRRTFLRSLAATTGTAALGPVASAPAIPLRAVTDTGGAREGVGPYGPLTDDATAGLFLPDGFAAREVAVSGQEVAGTAHPWGAAPDGAATFDDGAGGWYHVVNHEVGRPGGGVSVIHFAADGSVVDAYPVLTGTDRNCAGGPTPWGTWLSCEEVDRGQVFECDPSGPGQGTPVPALGRFKHEAVAVDPTRGRLYLTEDQSDGLLYRFTPAAYPSLGDGVLEAALVTGDAVTWTPIPDPAATDRPTRAQLASAEASRFDGGEGIWFHDDRVWFTTKGDGRVWGLDVASDRLGVLWEPAFGATLTGVDNVTVASASGDIFVAEDGGNMELVLISAEGEVAPFVRIGGHDGSEVTGPVFNPAGDRLYFSSQRGSDGRGVTYEVTGPFRSVDNGPGLSLAPPPPLERTSLRWLAWPALASIGLVAGVAAWITARRRRAPDPEPRPSE